jgi:hypothetical protein
MSLEDPKKRARLMQLLCGGALGSMPYPMANAGWFGRGTKKLDDDKSIFTLPGEVLVNDRPADKNTRIHAGHTVRTGN